MVEDSRKHLIEAELMLARSLCDLAETESKMGKAKHADQLVNKSKLAVASVRRYLTHAHLQPQEIEAIERTMQELETRFAALRSPRHRSAAAGSAHSG